MKMGFRKASLVLVLILLSFPSVVFPSNEEGRERFSLLDVQELFPSKGFERQIDFWKKVFTQYHVTQIVFHDEDDPRLVYQIEQFDRGIEGDSREAKRQREVLKRKLRALQGVFDEVIRSGADNPALGAGARHLIKVFRDLDYPVTRKLLRQKRETIRYQRGVREKFQESLVRSGMYLPWIERTFARYGLPVELAMLPHVESSFDYNAYSHAGAAGIWQFTRGTGRAYMHIGSTIDERLDPIRATEAAARLLSENYEVLGNWPLTITSYNHGRNGMIRAKRQYGDDLRTIVAKYRSKYFGFASRNFYTEFLAALSVARNYRDYFGELEILPPLEFDSVQLQKAYDISYFSSVDGIDDDVLRDLNPHLKRILSSRRRVIPAGIEVRVPSGTGASVEKVLASARPTGREVLVAADGSARYRVDVGDSIGAISAELKVPVSEILRLNRLNNPNRIYPGQVLLIRRKSNMAAATVAKATPEAANASVSGQQDAGSAETPVVYRVAKGDNLAVVARRFGTTVSALQNANGLGNPNLIQPGMQLKIPSGHSSAAVPSLRRYVVRGGDTLAHIAARFGTSVNQIRERNGIRNPNRIQPGQELLIP
jgi:membrane-bound lytic murein transglycosylase D